MVEKDTSHAISKIFNIVMGLLIFVAVFLYQENINNYALPVMIMLYMLVLIASSVFIRRHDILHGIIYSVFGQVYITMPLSLLMFISYSYHAELTGGGGYDWVPILALFVFLWVNDTAAYFIGSIIGKHKLIEHISPKKSVEGLSPVYFLRSWHQLYMPAYIQNSRPSSGWVLPLLYPCQALLAIYLSRS